MTKKNKKTDQTTDLQESEDKEITENPIEDAEKPKTENTKITENPEDEPETTTGMVFCKHCKKEVDPYSTEKGWRCPSCNKFVQPPEMKKEGETIREVKASKDRPYEIMSSRNVKFSGNELAQAEMLIQSGVASNFNELAKKAFNLIFIKEKLNKAFGNQNNTMESNKEPDPQKTMKQIQEQELMSAYIKNLDKGNSTDPMSTMMLMRMLDNQGKGKSSGDNNFMDKMMQLKMIESMSGKDNSQVLALQKEIADLKQQQQMQQMMNQQTQTQQTNQSSQQNLQRIEEIRAERDKTIKQAEIVAQQERDKNLSLVYDNRRIALESRLQAMEKEMKEKGSGQIATQRIKQMKEEIAAIKDMSNVLGHKEKGAGEYISETIGNVADKLGPTLMDMAKQKQEQRAMQQQMPQMQQPPPEPTTIEQPQSPEPQSDMTQTEQDISDQMQEMYFKKREIEEN